jgi:MTH538 TIR-like domain (DUF1863)
MARRTFFSFHYENDVWRAHSVRQSWVTKPDTEAAGFVDAADFEEVKKKGDAAVKKWIDTQLSNTSATVVLIGEETSTRDYIKYELEQSWKKGNGILGITIHKMKDQKGNTCPSGNNSFGSLFPSSKDDKEFFFQRFVTYDWVENNGYANMGAWIEEAAKKAGR